MKTKIGKVTAPIGAALKSVKDIVLKPLSAKNDAPVVSSSNVVVLSAGNDFASQLKKDSCTYIVKHAFDLNGETVELPSWCTLDFQGGSLSDGTLVGHDSFIRANGRIFENVDVIGTWCCIGNVGWWTDGTPVEHNQWGYVFPSLADQSHVLQQALDSSFRELHFPPKCYYISRTLILRKEKKIVLHGSDMKLSLENASVSKTNTSIIFSDNDICLLRIAVCEGYQNAVCIEGGSFDVSLCRSYTHSCIDVRADEEGQRLWGLTLNTNVKGKYNQAGGVGIDLNPVENESLIGNKAFVTQVRINSNVSNFGIGVRARSYHGNWCSDVTVDGSVVNCPVCIEMTGCDCDIRAMLQSGKFFDSQSNGVALVRIDSPYVCTISSNIFDILQTDGSLWSNEYALEVANGGCTVTAGGKFLAFYLGCKRMGWTIVKGNIEI